MRIRLLALLAAIGMALIPATAEAGHRGWHEHHGHHHHHRHYYSDRYSYEWEPRGYYPYYNSNYWRPTRELRYRRYARPAYVLPPYYQAWGHPHRHYHHRKWHRKHYGRHLHHHW